MDMKLKERACFRALGVSMLFMAAAVLQADNLFTNGFVAGSPTSTLCDGTCLVGTGPATTTYTIYDNFTVGPAGWIVTGFDYTDFLINISSVSNTYSSTQWSIWSGDPLGGGTLLKSGLAVATLGSANCTLPLSPGTCIVQLSVGGLAVNLTSGTYYIGTASLQTGTPDMERALSSGNGPATAGYEASNGTTIITSANGDTAFDVAAYVGPEPGTLTLMGLALAGLVWLARRRSLA